MLVSIYALGGDELPSDVVDLILELGSAPIAEGIKFPTAHELQNLRLVEKPDVSACGVSLGGQVVMLSAEALDQILNHPAPTYEEIVCQWDNVPASCNGLGDPYQRAFKTLIHELFHVVQFWDVGSTAYYIGNVDHIGDLEEDADAAEEALFGSIGAPHPFCPAELAGPAGEQLITDDFSNPTSLSNIGQMALYARSHLKLNDRVEVFGAGFAGAPSGCAKNSRTPGGGSLVECYASVGSGDDAYLGTDVRVDDIAAAGTLELRDRSQVDGSAFGEEVLLNSNGITIGQGGFAGGVEIMDALDTFEPPFPESYAGFPYLPPNSLVTVLPGSYYAMNVTPGTTVSLGAGTYYFYALTTESNSILRLDTSAGPIRIFVEFYLNLKGPMTGTDDLYSTWRETAGKVLIGYTGASWVNLDSGARLLGTLVAPNATVTAQRFVHVGAVYASSIEIHQDANWWYEPFFAQWLDPAGDP